MRLEVPVCRPGDQPRLRMNRPAVPSSMAPPESEFTGQWMDSAAMGFALPAVEWSALPSQKRRVC